MTWGFVTCGPNEALVVSGKSHDPYMLKIMSNRLNKYVGKLKWNCHAHTHTYIYTPPQVTSLSIFVYRKCCCWDNRGRSWICGSPKPCVRIWTALRCCYPNAAMFCKQSVFCLFSAQGVATWSRFWCREDEHSFGQWASRFSGEF